MAIKNIFEAMKKEGIVTQPLDSFLLEESLKDNDRAINVNAPSQAGKCQRANYYSRMRYGKDGGIDPRVQRIFDNGNHVHTRIQGYLSKMGLLICDEVPILNDEYNIQGHTDGLLDLSDEYQTEVAVLEIKSIKDNGYTLLKDALPEHKQQGLIYLYCLECRRKFLQEAYKTRKEFNSESSRIERSKYFESKYLHIKGGKKHTREEKIANEIDLNLIADDILYDCDVPVNKVVFLYENKNTQELKEFVVTLDSFNQTILDALLDRYRELNECCRNKTIPNREGTASSQMCRWCDFKIECFN